MTNRKANFGTALRILDLILLLGRRRTEWSVRDAADELGVHPKTVTRYVAALESRFVNDDGEPALQLVYRDKTPFIAVNGTILSYSPAIYDYASLFLAAKLLDFAGESQLRSGLKRIAKGVASTLPRERKEVLDRFRNKFYVYHVGIHKSSDPEILGDILSALVNERRLAVRYKDWDAPKVVEPMTLAVYKEGLYLIARMPGKPNCFVMNVQLIRGVDYLPREKFSPPPDWSPDGFRGDRFGMMPGPSITAVLKFRPHLEGYVHGRIWHPSQSIKKAGDGSVRLTMQVGQTPELLAWICSFADEVVVEKPASLRKDVAGRLQRAASKYARTT